MITEADRAESKKIQIRLLDALKDICDRNKLIYWIDFGTLLGALRYRGFIPWDDDIDVSMPMKDYKRFLIIAEKELPRDIFLQIPKKDPGYKQCFAKLRDCYSTFLEHNESGKEPYHEGIYIDIFPYVYYPMMPRILKKILLYITGRSLNFIVFKREHLMLNYILYGTCKFIWFILSPFRGNMLGRTPEDNGYYESIPKDVIFPTKDIEFEGKLYAGPNNPREHMALMYGKDYMTPPPPEKRVPHAKTILPNTPCNHPRALKRNTN